MSEKYSLLHDKDYVEKLHSLYRFYNDNLQDILELATIESDGVRPENLENEIYATFHHINRSMFEKNSVEDAISELDHAIRSHLTRVEYDSYKITINAILTRSNKIITDYEFLLSDEDFRSTMITAVEIFQKIRDTRKSVKGHYYLAKKEERKGNHDKAIESYNFAIDFSSKLQDSIDEIENNQSYKVALLAVHKKEKRFRLVERNALRNIIITGLILLVVNILTTIIVTRFFPSNNPNPTTPSTQQSTTP